MGSKRKLGHEQQLEAALTAAKAILESKGVVAASKLGPAAVRPQVVQRLCADGYEPTANGVRIALVVQGQKLLAPGKPLLLSELKKRLQGATATEAKDLVEQLRRAGEAQVVLRGKHPYLVAAGETALNRNELKAAAEKLGVLAVKLKATAGWLDKARRDKSQATVLTVDLQAEIASLTGLLEGAMGTSTAAPGNSTAEARAAASRDSEASVPLAVALRGAIVALCDGGSRLASIPNVSRRLRARASVEEVIDALLSEFKQGTLELRPEGGMGRLSAADAALCPRGPGGIPLSWVLLREE